MKEREGITSNRVESSEHTTLTMSIEGPHFPLTKFRRALDSFIDLLTEIDKETSDRGELTLEWAISSITSGSIHITAIANPVNEEHYQNRPTKVIETLARGLDQLQEAPIIPNGFNESALKYTKTFSEILNPNDFAEIQFRSNSWNKSIASTLAVNIDKITKVTQTFYGSIEGTLISIKVEDKKKRFGIRSETEGKTVNCYFKKDEMLEIAKDALGHRVYVFGLIRQHVHGPKINIQVDELRILPPADELPTVNDILAKLRS